MDSEELEYLNADIEIANAMNKLLNNKDFKKVFLDGFFKADMVQLGMNFTNVLPEKRGLIVEALLARGILRQYIDGIITSGVSAKSQLEESEDN